jgi:CHASE3 domain sensor protein
MKTDPVKRLTKLVQRLSDANVEEATVAFRQVRSHCRRHHIDIREFHLQRNDSLLDSYLAALDLLKQSDPRLAELEKVNQKLQEEIDRLRQKPKK